LLLGKKPMLEANDLHFAYARRLPVLSGVSLTLEPGEIIGLSGPSGGGKSTLGRVLAGYLMPDRGTVSIDGGTVLGGWSPVQYAHQSAILAVDPRWRIGRIIEEGWTPDAETRDAFSVSHNWYDRYPHEVSGGELQRVNLLRLLSPQTRYLIADEITAMLDPITQAEIWRTLLSRCARGLSILAISHDAALLKRVCGARYSFAGGVLSQA
jgi:peptide/nickel transport system ATP-binding protein